MGLTEKEMQEMEKLILIDEQSRKASMTDVVMQMVSSMKTMEKMQYSHLSKKEREANVEPIRSEPKIQRNDPCPCGSGKKYKKCCSI